MNVTDLNFLDRPSEILQSLLKSKEDGTAIGIKATCFGSEIIVTGVEDIQFDEAETFIVLKRYDSSGYILPLHRIHLPEIQSVVTFTTPFLNPFLTYIEKDKTWFF